MWFYRLILRNINGMVFRSLYSNNASRTNTPVNILVSALILKEFKVQSNDQLMESVMFGLRVKMALDPSDISEVPFSMATHFNFQNRILDYQQQTDINLIERIFDNLSARQIKDLSLNTDIQMNDSTLVSSKIKIYSSLQLLIEVLIRLYRILEEEDRQFIAEQLHPYLKNGTDKYIYGLKANQLSHELENLDKIKGKKTELNEMYTDDGYGSEDNDIKLEKLEIDHITTAIRKQESEIEKKIEETSGSPNVYTVVCSFQKVQSTQTKKLHKVCFNININRKCPLNDKYKIFKNKGRYYFTHEDYQQNRHKRNVMNLLEERHKIRPNIEALMNDFKIKTRGGKLKVRGLFKATLFAFNRGIAINSGRIYRFIVQNEHTEGYDSSIPAVLSDIMLKTVCLVQKLLIFACKFFDRQFYLEYFTQQEVLRTNMQTTQTLN